MVPCPLFYWSSRTLCQSRSTPLGLSKWLQFARLRNICRNYPRKFTKHRFPMWTMTSEGKRFPRVGSLGLSRWTLWSDYYCRLHMTRSHRCAESRWGVTHVCRYVLKFSTPVPGNLPEVVFCQLLCALTKTRTSRPRDPTMYASFHASSSRSWIIWCKPPCLQVSRSAHSWRIKRTHGPNSSWRPQFLLRNPDFGKI